MRIVLVLTFGLSFATASSADPRLDHLLDEFEFAVSNELHGAYACQDFVGGLTRYEIIRQDALSTLAKFRDRKEAESAIARMDSVIQSKAEHDGLREAVEASGELSEGQVTASCLDSLAALSEMVEDTKSKLGELGYAQPNVETAHVPDSR